MAEAVEGRVLPLGGGGPSASGVGWNIHCKTNISYSSVLTTSDESADPADRGRGMTKNGLALASEVMDSYIAAGTEAERNELDKVGWVAW